MIKNKKGKSLLIAIIAIVLMLILVYFFFISASSPIIPGGVIEQKVSATCDITIFNSPIASPKIENVYCEYKEVGICLTEQGWFADTGNIILSSAGHQDAKSFDIKEFQKQEITMKLCGMPIGTTTGVLRIYTNNKVVDEKQLTFEQA